MPKPSKALLTYLAIAAVLAIVLLQVFYFTGPR